MGSWIIQTVESMGAWGVGFLMLLENVVPPIPSELIMPLAGYLSDKGSMSLWPAILAGSIGSLAGATFWYYLARHFSRGQFRHFVARHGVWLGMDEGSVDHAQEWFHRHGTKAVFLGRMVPGLRTLISVPAGLSGMSLLPFLAWSAVGTAIWTILLAYAGKLLGSQFEKVDKWVGPVSTVILGGMLLWYVYRVLSKYRARS